MFSHRFSNNKTLKKKNVLHLAEVQLIKLHTLKCLGDTDVF